MLNQLTLKPKPRRVTEGDNASAHPSSSSHQHNKERRASPPKVAKHTRRSELYQVKNSV